MNEVSSRLDPEGQMGLVKERIKEGREDLPDGGNSMAKAGGRRAEYYSK